MNSSDIYVGGTVGICGVVWRQKMVRFYDSSGNLIEVRIPVKRN